MQLGPPGAGCGAIRRLGDARVITIQTALLVALGFLAAGFIVLLVMPFYRRRTERLAIAEVKRSLPMNEAEIRADKDRLRAEYAIRIHQLESRVEDHTHQAARQRIELNRRDGVISALEGEIGTLRTSLEEHENARRVLEQTITDRLPKVEHRLNQARELLAERDAEIDRLSRTANSTSRALEEARQLNTQQRDELLRSNATLASRAARNRDTLADPRFDGEVALRSEIEALRARSREQSEMVTRLQGLLVRGGKPAEARANGKDGASGSGEAEFVEGYEHEIAQLRSSLAETEAKFKAAQTSAEAGKADQHASESDLRAANMRIDELKGEVSRLQAALSIYEGSHNDDAAIKDSKVAMKARLGALEAEAQTHLMTIQSLRAEVAAANERLARQSAHYRDELRRLGAGTLPASAEPQATRETSARRASLTERMSAPRPVPLKPVVQRAGDEQRSASFLKALSGGAATAAGDEGEAAAETAMAQVPGPAGASSAPAEAPRRPSLLDRISSVSKSGS